MKTSALAAPLLALVAAISAMVIAIRTVLHAPGVPYNVRELFLDQASLSALVFFALTNILLSGYVSWVAASYLPEVRELPEVRTNPGTSFQPQLGAPVPVEPSTPTPTPTPAKIDRIVVSPNSVVEGTVVRNDSSPKANEKLLFINAGTGTRETIVTNTAGRFHAELAPGSWHVYMHGTDGVPVHHSRIDVNGAQTRQVNLVSRTN